MEASYSQDLRDRVLRALEREDRPTAIANRFEGSRVWGVSGTESADAGRTAEQSPDWRPSVVPGGGDGVDPAGVTAGNRRFDTRGAVHAAGGTRNRDHLTLKKPPTRRAA
ncbi:MAG: hypothetical protein HZC50_08205 [Nitrospirae bacterium]|nr:hypothetical protein [Nitrospirota bacterium]